MRLHRINNMNKEKLCDKCFIITAHNKDDLCLRCENEKIKKHNLLILDTCILINSLR